jgi:hypothetical protein
MKKNFISTISAVFIFISCASLPKKDASIPSLSVVPDTVITDTDTGKAKETVTVPAESPSGQQNTATDKNNDTYTDLSEPLSDADNPVFREQEIKAPAATEIRPDATGTIEEPVVRDEPLQAEKNIQPAVVPKVVVPEAVTPKEVTPKAVAPKEVTPKVVEPKAVTPKAVAPKAVTPKAAENVERKTKTEKDDSSGSENQEPKGKMNPVPSRSITIDKGQYLDVVYPGTGWVYLGETDGQKNMLFFGRKLGETDTTFTLRSRNNGTFLLHFYKNDILSGQYIDDYLEVKVSETVSNDSRSHVTAPSYAEAVPTRPSLSQSETDSTNDSVEKGPTENNTSDTTGPAAAISVPASKNIGDNEAKTVIQTTESAPVQASVNSAGERSSISSVQNGTSSATQAAIIEIPDTISADNLLKQAQELYNSKNYEDAYAYIQKFFEKAVSRIDEGLYLQGQILESKSSIQNIKGAIDSYDILQKDWPDSQLWQQAQKRSIYLKRFYINIR